MSKKIFCSILFLSALFLASSAWSGDDAFDAGTRRAAYSYNPQENPSCTKADNRVAAPDPLCAPNCKANAGEQGQETAPAGPGATNPDIK